MSTIARNDSDIALWDSIDVPREQVDRANDILLWTKARVEYAALTIILKEDPLYGIIATERIDEPGEVLSPLLSTEINADDDYVFCFFYDFLQTSLVLVEAHVEPHIINNGGVAGVMLLRPRRFARGWEASNTGDLSHSVTCDQRRTARLQPLTNGGARTRS